MSTKIKEQLAETGQRYIIEDFEMNYLNDIETVERSFVFYYGRLKTNYLQQIALRLGYLPEDKLEFSVDLKSPTRELTIKHIKD